MTQDLQPRECVGWNGLFQKLLQEHRREMKNILLTLVFSVSFLIMFLIGSAFEKKIESTHSAFEKKVESIYVNYDKFKNITRISTPWVDASVGNQKFDGGKDISSRFQHRPIEMLAAFMCEGQVDKCSPDVVLLDFASHTTDWTMISVKQVTFLIDGQPVSLPSTWDASVIKGGDLLEKNTVSITPDLLMQIANAKTVEVQIGIIDFAMSDGNGSRAFLKLLVSHIVSLEDKPTPDQKDIEEDLSNFERKLKSKKIEKVKVKKWHRTCSRRHTS